jgi:hypothetical protein
MSDALVTGLFAVAAAILGGIAGRSDLPERLRKGHLRLNLRGEWDSVWQATEEGVEAKKRELLVVTRQAGSRVYGHINYDPEPRHKWEFEGQFSGRFLQLIYFPTPSVQSAEPFLDYGCYFFEMQGDGSFEGYSVAFVWDKNRTEVTKHWLYRRK